MAAPPRGRRAAHCGGGARPPRPRGKVRDHCSSSEPRRRRRKLFSNFLFSPFRQSSAIRGAKLVLQCSQWPKLCLHFFSMQPTPASTPRHCALALALASLARYLVQALSQEVFARRVSVFSLVQSNYNSDSSAMG